METVRGRNVNDVYQDGLRLLKAKGERQPSRAGDVLVTPYPVTSIYEYPTERVLFDPQRDANPFFHVFEALWMIAGRNDARWLDRFVSDFSSRFAEDNGEMHGAYGYRWRCHFAFDDGMSSDQLGTIVQLLKDNPNDRRVVLQMWDPSSDLNVSRRDIPCNLTALPRIVNGQLDLTVFCRSNDAVWGAYGANAVHFSILQEYLAARIGVPVGIYYQISNNFHVYYAVLDKMRRLTMENRYDLDNLRPTPLVEAPDDFDDDLLRFMGAVDQGLFQSKAYTSLSYKNRFFPLVAAPMMRAHSLWKAKEHSEAIKVLWTMDPSNDWRSAALSWCGRRIDAQAK